MTQLNDLQIRNGYFRDVGGFLPLNETSDRTNYAREVKDFNGQEQLCIACTQLDSYEYSERERKRILAEWIDFLQTKRKAFKALHFNSRVPQELFNAACCQENLEELRFKWGTYSDLTALENLKKLKYLYIGQGSCVQDIMVLGKLKTLVVLYLEGFKKIEDYSILSSLEELEQLVISGPILGVTPIKDLEFLRNMNWLESFWKPNTILKKEYTSDELTDLKSALTNLSLMYGSML